MKTKKRPEITAREKAILNSIWDEIDNEQDRHKFEVTRIVCLAILKASKRKLAKGKP